MRNTILFKQKQSLSISLKLWLPILQSSVEDLDDIFKKYSYENPFLGFRSKVDNRTPEGNLIENILFQEDSFHDDVLEQICPPIFPTPISQKVAQEILLDIDNRGYFDGDEDDIAKRCNVTKLFVEKIRERFSHLEPAGIGAKDLHEACRFQLYQLDLDEELEELLEKMIKNFKTINKYAEHHRFTDAIQIIKGFNFVPSLDYMEKEKEVVPDFYVDIEQSDINVRINDDRYPDITIKEEPSFKSGELKTKLKEARDLVGLLELRKSTLYKLVLIIVEKQMSFFVGGELKPLVMRTIAEELGFEESTISRAVSNKYLQCAQGVFPLKHFFTNAVSKGLSSSEVKNFMVKVIENESHESPLNDDEILEQITNRFGVKMVRRTITKYRQLLDIPSSKERKKLYIMDVS